MAKKSPRARARKFSESTIYSNPTTYGAIQEIAKYIDDKSVRNGTILATARECFATSASKGFWDSTRNKGEQIALIHSELSEMLEAVRNPGQDSHCPEFSAEAIEWADAMIRLLDYGLGHGLPMLDALRAKMDFNKSRPPKHGKAF